MSVENLDYPTARFANHLRIGGKHRLAALAKLRILIRTDCGHQVGQMVGKGWEGKEAAEAYRQWLLDWAAETVETFIAEDLLP